VLAGSCQVSIVDPDGVLEVVNYGPGDVWYFPAGHAHAIQTLGTEPCHAILAFDDGLYSEHGTFGVTDWISRLDPDTAGQALGVAAAALASLPPGETYIMQGEILPLDGPEARTAKPHGIAHTHRFALGSETPVIDLPCGSVRAVSAREFPVSRTMAGLLIRLQPGAMQPPHWHPQASEWHYVVRGRMATSLFAADKRLAQAELGPGDCAYIPRGCGHVMRNVGDREAEIIAVMDSPRLETASLADWLSQAPRHVVANNLRMAARDVPDFKQAKAIVEADR